MSTTIPGNVEIVRGEPETCRELAGAVGGNLSHLASVAIGVPVVTHATSWVRVIDVDTKSYFVKTYSYRSVADRLRAWRWTAPGRNTRPSREFDALVWLRQHGFSAPRPVAALEQRQAGFVRFAVLVTERWPGTDLATLFPTLSPAERRQLAQDLHDAIEALHDAGFRAGNLDLRNLLARRAADHWEFAKIDSPKFRIVGPGKYRDRHRRADWERLAPQLAEFGLAAGNRAV